MSKNSIHLSACRFLRLTLCGAWLLSAIGLWAQEEQLSKSLTLVKPYQPSVSDAQKQLVAPGVYDTTRLQPVFEYIVTPQQGRLGLGTEVPQPKLPDAADTATLSHGYLSEGAGNYRVKDIAAGYHSGRNGRVAYGADFTHFSLRGKTRLGNGLRVPSKQSDNQLTLYGKYFAERMTWDAHTTLARRVTHGYGYNYFIMPDTVINNRNRYLLADAEAHMQTLPGAYGHDLDARGGYRGIKDNHDYRENWKYLSGSMPLGFFTLSAEADHIRRSSRFDTLSWVVSLGATARLTRRIDWFTVKAGLPTYFVKEDGLRLKWRIWPELEVQYHGWLSAQPYAGVRGGVQLRTYRDLLVENPFMTPGTLAAHSYTPWDVYAGVQGGDAVRRLRYSAEVSFRRQKNTPFFVNRNDGVGNQFDVVCDNLSLLTLRGEVQWQILPVLRLDAAYSFYGYDPEHFEKAWHMPRSEADIEVAWHFLPRWSASVSTERIGARYGLLYDAPGTWRKMKPFTDLGAKVMFRMMHNSIIYLELNNLSSKQYERWMFYPTQKLNFIIGSHYYFK
ncbi:MAG: hypothetical protein IKI72_02460 [Bacteroidales bacterium]|nr:hypothetical protein [Bacteroidales bacterium]